MMHSRLAHRVWWRTRGKRSELAFWAAWLVGAPGAEEWASDRELRLSADTEIRDPVVRAEIQKIAATEISILDVGAGPMTPLGYRFPGKHLTIVPVDPLGKEYARLLRDAGLEPPVRTIPVAGELLLEHFGRGSFDIAHAVNSLDHSVDPLTILRNMVAVVREGGVVLIRHQRNEGERERYEGLHQWNFEVVRGRLSVWNNAGRIDVANALEDCAAIEAWVEEDEVVARLVPRGG